MQKYRIQTERLTAKYPRDNTYQIQFHIAFGCEVRYLHYLSFCQAEIELLNIPNAVTNDGTIQMTYNGIGNVLDGL
jgi:hypothetical protein